MLAKKMKSTEQSKTFISYKFNFEPLNYTAHVRLLTAFLINQSKTSYHNNILIIQSLTLYEMYIITTLTH